jgi:HK97 family phage major capsid protein
MTGMRELLEQRAAKKAEMETLNAKHGSGTFPDEAQRHWDTLNGEMQAIEQRISRQSTLDATEERIRGTPVGDSADNRWNDLIGGYSLCRALLYNDSAVDSGREKEVSAEMEKRTGRSARGLLVPDEVFMRPIERRAGQTASDGVSGGFLVGDVLQAGQFVDLLRSASVLPRLGVQEISGLVGSQSIPKQIGASSITWIAENEEPAESALAFGMLAATPRTAAGEVAFSRRTLLNSTPSIDALVRSDLARQQAIAVDRAAINGIGQKVPLGLLGRPIKILPITAHALSYDNLVDMTAAPDIADALLAGPAWLTNPRVIASALKLKNLQGTPYFSETLPGSLLGYPVVSSTSVPHDLAGSYSALIFGAWSSLLVCRWSGIDVLSNPYSRAGTGAVLIHTFQDIDIVCRHEESFVAAIDITA